MSERLCLFHFRYHGQCRLLDAYKIWRFKRIIRKHGSKKAAEIIRRMIYGDET